MQFAAYIPFYPDCSTSYATDTETVARPIRIFHGTPDDYNPVASCKAYLARLQDAKRDAALTEYPDSAHGFDAGLLGVSTVAVSVNAQSARNCRLKEGEGGVLMNDETKQPFTDQDACIAAQSTRRRQSGDRGPGSQSRERLPPDVTRIVIVTQAGPLQPVRPFATLGLIAQNRMEASEMSGSNLTRAALLFASLSLAGNAALAAPASPFVAMAGTWSGGGVVNTSDGQQERLRCRASYDVDGAGDQLRLNLTCASDSFRLELASDVEYRGGAIRGSWTEASHNASGTLSGRAAGDHVEASARGDAFSANLSLTTHRGRQTVSIEPQGTSIRSVSLALNRH